MPAHCPSDSGCMKMRHDSKIDRNCRVVMTVANRRAPNLRAAPSAGGGVKAGSQGRQAADSRDAVVVVHSSQARAPPPPLAMSPSAGSTAQAQPRKRGNHAILVFRLFSMSIAGYRCEIARETGKGRAGHHSLMTIRIKIWASAAESESAKTCE